MKLAQALQERADLNRNIEQLTSRLKANALYQDGEETLEDVLELKNVLDNSFTRLNYLMEHINITNTKTIVNDKSLTEWIAKKDTLIIKITKYKDIIYEASQNTLRARGSEIKIKTSLDIKSWQKEVDQLAKELREIDNLIQETNWTTELI